MKNDYPIAVMVVDDHPMVRKGLASFLLSNPGLRLAGEASNGKEAFAMCQEKPPDVILMDLVMPVLDGFSASEKIRELYPHVKIIALTSYPDSRYLQRAMSLGLDGFILKDISSEDLSNAIRSVHDGSRVFSVPVERMLQRKGEDERKIDTLTPREYEVFGMLLEGYNNPQIAERLVLSRSTVKVHVSRVLEKLGVTNRVELLKKFTRS